MRAVYMVMVEETAAFEVLVHNTPEIQNAMERAAAPPAFTWVGPTPRVTRDYSILTGPLVRVAWPAKFDDPSVQTDEEARELIAHRVDANLESVTRPVLDAWRPTQVVPYVEAINGPLSYWRSGQAAVTRTANESEGVLAALRARENPVGPENPRLRPMSPGELLADFMRQLNAPSFKATATMVLIGLGLVYFGPALGQLASAGAVAVSSRAKPREKKSA